MKKNYLKALTGSDLRTLNFSIKMFKFVLLYIPRRYTTTKVLQFIYSFKTYSPVVYVFLVTKFAIFCSGIAPLKTGVTPPPQCSHTTMIISKSYKLNTIFSAGICLIIFCSITVFSYQNRFIFHFINQHLRI